MTVMGSNENNSDYGDDRNDGDHSGDGDDDGMMMGTIVMMTDGGRDDSDDN